ncbi:MAG: HD domain-containing protein [SAR202 cluster bacterium]|nr:HD domain-containing protein [SAR202 cluster bacterium]
MAPIDAGIHAAVRRRLLELPRGLREHVHRVEGIAVELAHAHAVDEARSRLCAQAHDLCRAMKGEELLSRARDLGLPIHPVEEAMPVLLHGPVAAELLRLEGLDDEGIYQGVYYHSTAAPRLEPVAKVVFIADKLDPQKIHRYPYIPELKTLAMSDLNRAMLEFLTRETIGYLQEGGLVHPLSIEARNHLLLGGGKP